MGFASFNGTTRRNSAADYEQAKVLVFSEPPMDNIYDDTFPITSEETIIAFSLLPGQYDQRADSAAQCIQLISLGDRPNVSVARVIVLKGSFSDADLARIRKHVINPVEAHEVDMERPITLETTYPFPADVSIISGFCDWHADGLKGFHEEMGFAMSLEDLQFCQEHFKGVEQRDPSITELRMIDTYWSDHCRHTTFLTALDQVTFAEGPVNARIASVWHQYLSTREVVHAGKEKTSA